MGVPIFWFYLTTTWFCMVMDMVFWVLWSSHHHYIICVHLCDWLPSWLVTHLIPTAHWQLVQRLIILCSCDSIDFHVHSIILCFTSPFPWPYFHFHLLLQLKDLRLMRSARLHTLLGSRASQRISVALAHLAWIQLFTVEQFIVFSATLRVLSWLNLMVTIKCWPVPSCMQLDVLWVLNLFR
jgi:hypothetical protein